MAAPDNRVPVRLARGTKATLDTNIADLYEGEICYATDENICYVKEGSFLEPASGGVSNLGGLSDVDLSTPATNGQILIWSTVDSAFLPGDAANPVASIDDLNDVDITTVAPTNGQALVWSAADSEFQPGDVSTSVAFADLTDYEVPVSYTVYDGVSEFTGTTGGIYYAYSASRLAINNNDEASLVLDDSNIAQVGVTVEISTDGGATWPEGVTVTSQNALPSAGFGYWRFDHDGPADWPSNLLGAFATGTDIRLRWPAGTSSVGDGNILAYNTTNSTWQPVPNTAPTVEELFNTDFGTYGGNTTYVNDNTPDDNAGEWYMANATDYIAYNNAQSGAGKMGDLQVGDNVTITYSDNSTESFEVQEAEADNSAGSKFIRFTTAATAVIASGAITLSATPARFGAAPGEVLTWNGSAWVSTTPATAVDELDDIANVDAKVTSGTSFGRYASFTADPPAANGEWRAESYNELRLFFTDSDGVDVQSAFDALSTSGSIWIVPDGDFGNVTEVTYTGTTNQTTYGRFTGTNIDDAINTYSEIAVYTTLPSENAPADGQILSYSTSSSKWTVGSVAVAANDLTDVTTDIPGGDEFWADVVFLFNAEDGSEGGSTFTDLSPIGATGTAYGTAGELTTTAASAKFGNFGVQGNSSPTTQYGVSYPFNSAYNLGSGDFTIDFWFQAPTSSDRGGALLGLTADGTGSKYCWAVDMLSDGGLRFNWTTDGGNTFIDEDWGNHPSTTGVWHHYALVRGGIGSVSYNTTAVSPFPVDAGPLACTVNAVTGNGTGSTVEVFTDSSGNLSFPQSLTPGVGYQIGDEVTVDEDGGTGQFTATVTFSDLRVYHNGVESSTGKLIDETIFPGDSDNQLLFMSGNGVNGDQRNAAKGYFDEVRVTKAARYTADFTPPTGPNITFGAGPQDGQVLTYVAANSRFEPVALPSSAPGATELNGLSDATIPGQTFSVIGSGRFDTPLGAFPTGNAGEYYDQAGQNRIFISDTDADSVDMNQFFQGTDQVGNTLQIATDAGFTDLLVNAEVTAYSDQSGSNRYYFTWGFDLGFSLTGTIYVRVGEYVTSLVDGQALAYNSATTQWEPRTLLEDLSGSTVGQLSNVKADTPTPITTTWNVIASGDASANMPSASAYGGGGGLALHPTSIQGDVKADLQAFIAQVSPPFAAVMIVDSTEYPLNITGINDTGIDGSGAFLPKVVFNHDAIGAIPTGGTLELVEFSAFRGELAITPSEGQVLAWNNTNTQWEPSDLNASSTRLALGIGEYADDAAAGTGGVTTGALYYNTTSSDYRLKS